MVKYFTNILYFTFATSLFFFCICQNQPGKPFERISPRLVWKTEDLSSTPEEVDSIRFRVYSTNNKFHDTIRATFHFKDHRGILTVPAESKLTILVEGLDAEGVLVYKGKVEVEDASKEDIEIVLDGADLTPKKVSDVEIKALSACNFSISWKDNSKNESGFIIQYKNGDGTFTSIDTVQKDITTYLHTKAKYSRLQTYAVTAYNNAGTSARSIDSILSPQVEIPNKAPVFIVDAISLNKNIYIGQTYKIPLKVFDPNCDPVSIEACSLLTISADTAYLSPKISDLGKIKLWLVATDDIDLSDTLFLSSEVRDSIRPQITLKGSDTIRLAVQDRYVEPGATAIDNVEGNISDRISITGEVLTSKEGQYTKEYSVTDSFGNSAISKIRHIHVANGALPDGVSPVIFFIGEDTLTHISGTQFTDPGVYALDNRDDSLSITNAIKSNGTVDIGRVGVYQIRYTVSDSKGNKDERFRYVRVIEGEM